MEKEVLLKIKGTHGSADEKEIIEVEAKGQYIEKNNKIYVTYVDTSLDNVKTTIKISNKKISVLRFGVTNANLVFEKGITHTMPYETPYGLFQIDSRTDSIKVCKDEKQIEVNVNYYMEINNMPVENNIFNIKMIYI